MRLSRHPELVCLLLCLLGGVAHGQSAPSQAPLESVKSRDRTASPLPGASVVETFDPEEPGLKLVIRLVSRDSVCSVAFRPDRRGFATGSFGSAVTLWSVKQRDEVRTFRTDSTGERPVWSLAFSPDGKQLLTGSGEGGVILWDSATGKQIRSFDGHTGVVQSVAFSPDGRRVLTGSHDSTAVLWDATTGERVCTLQGHKGAVLSVAFGPRGDEVLTGYSQSTAILWDVAPARKLRELPVEGSRVRSVAFSCDGRRALTTLGNKGAVVWDLATGRELRTFKGHCRQVNSAAFSPDGSQVVTGAGIAFEDYGEMYVWDVITGKKLQSFGAQKSAAMGVLFSAKGTEVLSVSWDGTARLHDTGTGQELARFYNPDRAGDWLIITPDGYFDGSIGSRKLLTWRQVFPIDRYETRFHRPGLMSRVLEGQGIEDQPNMTDGKRRGDLGAKLEQ